MTKGYFYLIFLKINSDNEDKNDTLVAIKY